MTPEEQTQLEMLKQQVESLQAQLNLNNFEGSQDFNKYSRFNTRLKIPRHNTEPTTCEIGEVIEDNGVLKICSATNTWAVVGGQS